MNLRMAIVLLLGLFTFYCRGLTSSGRLFKQALQLENLSGPTNRYAWTFPSTFSISNQTFQAGMCRQDRDYFDVGLVESNGTVVGSCVVRIATSAGDALDMICDQIRLGCAAPVQISSSVWHVERDGLGNVLFKSRFRDGNGVVAWDRSIYYRTYGNLYVRVAINSERTAFNSWDFALPLILGGLKNR